MVSPKDKSSAWRFGGLSFKPKPCHREPNTPCHPQGLFVANLLPFVRAYRTATMCAPDWVQPVALVHADAAPYRWTARFRHFGYRSESGDHLLRDREPLACQAPLTRHAQAVPTWSAYRPLRTPYEVCAFWSWYLPCAQPLQLVDVACAIWSLAARHTMLAHRMSHRVETSPAHSLQLDLKHTFTWMSEYTHVDLPLND